MIADPAHVARPTKVARQLYEWFPSPVPEEPMFLVLAAGGGGGWAVNAFYPKETGTISLDLLNLYGIFAHEPGHTIQGETIDLPVAPIEPTRAVAARHDPIGDFPKPLRCARMPAAGRASSSMATR